MKRMIPKPSKPRALVCMLGAYRAYFFAIVCNLFRVPAWSLKINEEKTLHYSEKVVRVV
jgi:hypothetical protein